MKKYGCSYVAKIHFIYLFLKKYFMFSKKSFTFKKSLLCSQKCLLYSKKVFLFSKKSFVFKKCLLCYQMKNSFLFWKRKCFKSWIFFVSIVCLNWWSVKYTKYHLVPKGGGAPQDTVVQQVENIVVKSKFLYGINTNQPRNKLWGLYKSREWYKFQISLTYTFFLL